jgi:hypothetical protein
MGLCRNPNQSYAGQPVVDPRDSALYGSRNSSWPFAKTDCFSLTTNRVLASLPCPSVLSNSAIVEPTRAAAWRRSPRTGRPSFPSYAPRAHLRTNGACRAESLGFRVSRTPDLRNTTDQPSDTPTLRPGNNPVWPKNKLNLQESRVVISCLYSLTACRPVEF